MKYMILLWPHANARYRAEGPDSGEEFRESLLEPKYILARNSNQKLIINLDGAYGYPTSFLEEAFGGLARKYGSAEVADTLEFISEDEPSLIQEINGYIQNCKDREKQ